METNMEIVPKPIGKFVRRKRDIEIYELRTKGLTYKEIGLKYSLTKARIMQIFLKIEELKKLNMLWPMKKNIGQKSSVEKYSLK